MDIDMLLLIFSPALKAALYTIPFASGTGQAVAEQQSSIGRFSHLSMHVGATSGPLCSVALHYVQTEVLL